MKRGSRKRCRGSSCSGGEDRSRSCSCRTPGAADCEAYSPSEVEGNGLQEYPPFEAGASRCSVHLIHEVVSKFDDQKIQIVEQAGFKGILNFPPFKQFNRRFGLWLMSCVDPSSRTLNIGEDISIKFTKSDVGHVLGIPCRGKDALDSRLCSREVKEMVLNRYLGSRFKEQRSIKWVQEIIEREYLSPMTQSDIDRFKVAFVVFVVSNLLAPSAKYDYASIDYWSAIADPGCIHTYDWGEFVLVKLVEAVRKLKDDLASNIKFPIISGCCIFLQVFYLDSLDLEGCMLRHNSFPRVREFSYERMRIMISEERNFLRYVRCVDDIPRVKLRDPLGCVYSWAYKWVPLRKDSSGGSMFALWEAVVAMLHLLDVPLEAAGPVFVAASNFQEQVNAGMFPNGTLALKFMSVILSIMAPYRRAHRNQFVACRCKDSEVLETTVRNGVRHLSEPIRSTRRPDCKLLCDQCPGTKENGFSCDLGNPVNAVAVAGSFICIECTEIGDVVQRSISCSVAGIDRIPSYLDVNHCVYSAMKDFYSVMSRMKSSQSFDLNSCCTDETEGHASSSMTSCHANLDVPAPWEIGFQWLTVDGQGCDLIMEMRTLCDFERMVIVHRNPRYIQISGCDLYAQAVGDYEMDVDLLDILVRSIRQRDDELYSSYGDHRWRRVFDCEVMASILSGSSGFVHGNRFRDCFCERINAKDVIKSKILFFPALVQCSWVCFAWVLSENVIYVFEPSQLSPVEESRIALIEGATSLFKIAMDAAFVGLIKPGRFHPLNALVRMVTLPDSSIPRLNLSGALCYMFFSCFDGVQISPCISSFDKELVSFNIFQAALTLKGNTGNFPDNLARYIE